MGKAKGLEELAENGAAFMSVYAQNPDLLKGIDPERIAASAKTNSTALAKYRHYLMSDQNRWTVLPVPTDEWAQKIFPNSTAEEAVAKLWEQIFAITRV